MVARGAGTCVLRISICAVVAIPQILHLCEAQGLPLFELGGQSLEAEGTVRQSCHLMLTGGGVIEAEIGRFVCEREMRAVIGLSGGQSAGWLGA